MILKSGDHANQDFRDFLDLLPDAVLVTDAQGFILVANDQVASLFGRDTSQLLGASVETLIPERFRRDHAAHIERFLETPSRRPMGESLDLFGLRADGREFPVAIALSPWRSATGILIVCAIRDVSVRRSIEQDLRDAKQQLEERVLERTARLAESNNRLQTIINAEPECVAIWGEDGVLQEINPAGLRMLEADSPDQVVGRKLENLLPKESWRLVKGVHEAAVNHGEPGTVTFASIGLKGSVIHLEAQFVPFGNGVLSVTRDITEKLRTERLLREQENLAQLGKMAAVVAHEVRNPLAAITGAIQLIRDQIPTDHMSIGILDEIIERTRGLSLTMKDLLDFARPPTAQPVRVPIRHLIERLIGILVQDPQWKGIDVHVEGSDDIHVRGDVQQLNQVMTNILLNGAQALQGSGAMVIRIDSDDQHCSIAVRDDGPGMADDVRERVFEPFFTTKVRGTGLGLPTVRRFVESHGGTVSVDCPPEGGTVVSVQLPLFAHHHLA